MKENGNNLKQSDYYIGLDVGTNSVGWAVADTDYNIPKFKGNAMWGVRLFEEANSAQERRTTRIARRLNARKKQRLDLLELLFNEEIAKIDPAFLIRMKESSLIKDDKSSNCCYSLFNDPGFTDKDYYKLYPTAYHLRSDLIHSNDKKDLRLIFLGLHHIIKSRGHFLFEMNLSEDSKSLDSLLVELKDFLFEDFGSIIEYRDLEKMIEALTDQSLSITAKKSILKNCVFESNQDGEINGMYAIYMLSGAKINLCDLFKDEELKSIEKKSYSLKSDLSEDYDNLLSEIGEDRVEVIIRLKEVFDCAKLTQMLGRHDYICDAKIEQFNTNKTDLKKLKEYVKNYYPEKYKKIFTEKSEKINNYVAYSRRTLASGEHVCTQEDFCKFLLNELPNLKTDNNYSETYNKINNGIFLSKLKGSENSVIPNQLHKKELIKILENAEKHYAFLSRKDNDGISVKDKIVSVFEHRIPYYVGPLNESSPRSWVVRTKEKIYPWNFNKQVDLEKSSQNFILRLISKCTYTGDDVMPKESLLYSEYCVLNEINNISVNGERLSPEVKTQLFTDLFKLKNSNVTKKTIKNYLVSKGLISQDDEIAGVDDKIKSKLKSYHSFSKIIDVDSNYDLVESIIRAVTIFGDDKKILRKWLNNNCPCLDKAQIDAVLRLKFKDWGSFSKTFLMSIYSPDENGEAHSFIDMLRNTCLNHMQLLSDNYYFRKKCDEYRAEKYGTKEDMHSMIEDMYVSPAVKRSIYQTVKIVDEIVDIKKSAPKKIFVEVARDRNNDNEKKRTETRKEKLLKLYENCKKEYSDLYDEIKVLDESDLRKDALYLYYTQFGKCMYSGKNIEIENLETHYDIDHIYPQSKIKDDSINNRVLVLRKYNEEKSNTYPIKSEWRLKMTPFWKMLKDRELISVEKYNRLVRYTPLTDEELSSFVQRQLVETRQSTKALCELLDYLYKSAKTKIVYSKAGNVSEFRQEFDFIKCRDVNDLHHAKDAYLNIVVGNVYDTKFTSDFFKNIENENYSLNRVFEYDTKGAWVKDKTIVTVKGNMRKNNILVTRRPYMFKGALFDLQILPKNKGQLPVKQGKLIENYGGYNKISGSFFFVVEHTVKNERVRTIQPVLLYKKDLYDKSPEKYCVDILGLSEPKIIHKQILNDSIIIIDNKRLFLTGRTGDQYLCKHDYQLSLSYADEKYIKEISKYVERSTLEKAQNGIKLSPKSTISKEKNCNLYLLFTEKLESAVYNRIFSHILKTLKNSQEIFVDLSLINQCKLLLEILKFFKCDRQKSDLSLIGGSKNSGTIRINKSLKKIKSAYAVNQSVTGLYEYKTNLLD